MATVLYWDPITRKHSNPHTDTNLDMIITFVMHGIAYETCKSIITVPYGERFLDACYTSTWNREALTIVDKHNGGHKHISRVVIGCQVLLCFKRAEPKSAPEDWLCFLQTLAVNIHLLELTIFTYQQLHSCTLWGQG